MVRCRWLTLAALALEAAAASALALLAASLDPKSSVKYASTAVLRSAVGAHLRSAESMGQTHFKSESLFLMPPRKGPWSVQDLGGEERVAAWAFNSAGRSAAVTLTPIVSSAPEILLTNSGCLVKGSSVDGEGRVLLDVLHGGCRVNISYHASHGVTHRQPGRAT